MNTTEKTPTPKTFKYVVECVKWFRDNDVKPGDSVSFTAGSVSTTDCLKQFKSAGCTVSLSGKSPYRKAVFVSFDKLYKKKRNIRDGSKRDGDAFTVSHRRPLIVPGGKSIYVEGNRYAIRSYLSKYFDNCRFSSIAHKNGWMVSVIPKENALPIGS